MASAAIMAIGLANRGGNPSASAHCLFSTICWQEHVCIAATGTGPLAAQGSPTTRSNLELLSALGGITTTRPLRRRPGFATTSVFPCENVIDSDSMDDIEEEHAGPHAQAVELDEDNIGSYLHVEATTAPTPRTS